MADLGTAVGRIQILFEDAGVNRAKAAMADLGVAANTLGGAVDSAGTRLALFGAGITAPFAAATLAAGNFEAQLNAIASVGGLEAQKRLGEIEAAALEMGANTKFSASQAAAGMEELIKAGLPVQDVLDGAGQAALDLAAATGTAVPQAAEIMATALNVFSESMIGFNSEGEKAVAISNLFAQAANASATDVGELGQAFSQAGLVANQFGIPVEEVTAQLGIFANAGLKGSDAGTSFKTMLQSLLDPTAKQAAKMDELGMSFFNAQGDFIGLDGVASELSLGLAGLTDEQRQTALAVLFGSDAVRAATVIYDQGAGGIQEFAGQMENAGTVAEQAAIRNSGLNGSLDELRGAAETLAISIGKELIPRIQPLIEAFTGVLRSLNDASPALKAFIGIAGGGIGIVATLGGGVLLFAGQVGQSIAALRTFKTALDAAKASSALLSGALGPIGIAFTAAAVAGGLFIAKLKEIESAARTTEEIIGRLEEVQRKLNAAQDAGPLAEYAITQDELLTTYAKSGTAMTLLADDAERYNIALDKIGATALDSGKNLGEFSAIVAYSDGLIREQPTELDKVTAAYEAYNKILAYTGPAQDVVGKNLRDLTALYLDGTLGPEEYAAALEHLYGIIPDIASASAQVQKIEGQNQASWSESANALGIYIRAIERRTVSEAEAQAAAEKHAKAEAERAAKAAENARTISTSIVGNVHDYETWTKAQEEAGVATRYLTRLTEEQTAALSEIGDELNRNADEMIAAAQAQSEAIAAAAQEQADEAVKQAQRAGKERVKALEDTGRDAVRIVTREGNQRIAEAERTEDAIVAAAEASADARIKAAERVEQESSRAVERAAALTIREAERTEARTVAAAERQAEAQLAAVEAASEEIVAAAEAQADAQVEAARQAEEATVDAAERAADAAVAAAERQAEDQVAAIEAASDRIVEAAERQADRQVDAARDAEEKTVAAAERAAERQVAEAERLADRQEAAVDRRLDRAQEAADRELEIVRDRIDKQVTEEIRAAQAVYDARADEIDWVADREKDAISYEFNEQYKQRTRAVEDAADAEVAAIRALGLTREEEAQRILEVERRREDELDRIRYENQQAELERIRQVEAERTAALAAAQAERERLEEEARARAEEQLAQAEERTNRIKEKAAERAAKRQAEIDADLEQAKRDAADKTAQIAAKAAKVREDAETLAAENVARVRQEQEAIVEAKTRDITDRLELYRQQQADRTAQVAADAAARRELAETLAAENVARVQAEQAQIAADAEKLILDGLEDAKRQAARDTAQVRRDEEKAVRDAEKELAKTTADEIEAINDDLEQARQDAADETERVRKEADKAVADAEKINQQNIRAAVQETETAVKAYYDRRDARVKVAADFAITEEQRIRREAARALFEAQQDAKNDGLMSGEFYVDGMKEGVENKTGDLTAAVKKLAQDIKRTLEEELEIKSPSRWARGVGLLVGDGLRLGLQAAMRDVSRSAGSVADALKGQLETAADVQPIADAYVSTYRAGLAAQQSMFRQNLGAANAAALAMPQSLEATVVIDGTDMGRFVVGTALAPMVEAARRTGTRREAWA